jgi:PAS domain S-box-containing protein
MADKKDLDENKSSETALRAAAKKKLSKSSDTPPELKEKTPEEIVHELQVYQIELEMQNEELKRVELELEKSRDEYRDKYRDLYDFAPVGYLTLTRKGIIEDINLSGASLLGMNRSKLIGRSFGYFVAPESLGQWDKHILAVIKTEDKKTCDLTLQREDGSSVYACLESVRMDVPSEPQWENKHSYVIQTAVTDITERKQAEEKLRESEQFLRQSEEISRIGGWKTNPFTDSLKWTQGVYDIVEAPKDYQPGLNEGLEFYTPPYRPILKEAVAKTLEHGEPFAIEAEVITESGKHLWTEVRGLKRVADGEEPQVIGSFQDITERKFAEEAVHQNQENFRRFFDTMDDIIVVVDTDGRIIHANSTASLKLGYTPDELKTMHVLDLNPKSQRQEAERILKEIFEGKRDTCPLPLAKKDGTLIPAENRIWFGKWSGTDCVFGICKDLSKEQEALQKFNRLFEFNPNPLAVGSIPDGKFVEINESFLTTLGFSREEVIGRTPGELSLFVNPKAQENAAQGLVDGRLTGNIELQVRKKDGGILDGLFFGTVIDSQGEKFLLTVMLDVTDRKAADALLKESEAKFRTFVDFTHDWEYWITPDGRITHTAPSCERITGYPAADFINNPDLLGLIVHPEDQGKWTFHRGEITDASGPQKIDFRIVDRNGRIVWIAHSCQGVFGPDGAWLGRRASNRDVTQRLNAERQIVEHLSMIEGVLKNAAEGICVCHSVDEYPFMRFTQWNQWMTEITGYSMDEINRLGWYQSMYPDPELQNRAIERMARMRTGDDIRGEEWVITTQGGQARPVLISTSLLTDSKGANHVLAVIHDITDRKRLEAERLEIERNLLHTQKLESLGIMAGGIAHDFNNQLAVVLGNLELALSDLPPAKSELRTSIMNAIEASERSAELSRQMLIYSGSHLYLPKEVQLGELLDKNSVLLKLVVPAHITLNVDTYSALPPIKGDPDQIQRVIMNLLMNASEAIGATKGAMTIRTGVMDCDDAYLSHSRLAKKPESGAFAFLEVSDNGCGMDAETQRKLFDPFFTTKFCGRGLGMAEVMGIVKGHNGAIMVDSEVGKGTIVRVLFSAPKQALAPTVHLMEAVETQPAVSVSSGGRKTILLVDDEELVRGMVVRRLEVLGYLTITASDGEEGVRIFRERLHEIDLVMLDFAMPKMNGVEAFGELIRIKPDVKVILCSGYTEDVVLESFPDQRPAGVLHKPYKMEALKAELERLLGSNA